MKRIIKKIKDVFLFIELFLISRTKNVFGFNPISIQPDYGVYEDRTPKKFVFLEVLKKSLYPLIFVIITIIGLIMTLKRSKKSKMSIIEMVLLISFTLYFGTYFIVKEYSFRINKELIWLISKTFYIPFLFIIGSIIYLIKSKSSKTKKILTLLILLLLIIAICFGINYILQK